MARLIDRDVALQKMKDKELLLSCGVKWKGDWYGILSDDDGPVYSFKATQRDLHGRWALDRIYMDGSIDTVTYRLMYGTDAVLG